MNFYSFGFSVLESTEYGFSLGGYSVFFIL